MKKFSAVILALGLLVTAFAGCGTGTCEDKRNDFLHAQWLGTIVISVMVKR